jgi:hypothetical protein
MDIYKTSYELLKIVLVTGVLYLHIDLDVLSHLFSLNVPSIEISIVRFS